MNNQKMKKKDVIISVGTAAVCAAALSLTFQKKKEKEEEKFWEETVKKICPVCGSILNESNTCTACGNHFHTCPSCGNMMRDTTFYCKRCGMENEDARFHTIQGIRYQVNKREPDPRMKVTHEWCSCGTPFAPDARYCQFCGKVRPRNGESYMRKDMPVCEN